MDAVHLITFNLALLAAMASPGPALLLALRNTLAHGRLAGVFTGLGLGTMAAIWTLAALFGLDTIFALFPWAHGAIKTAGAIYLLWIAISTWRSATAPLAAGSSRGRHAGFLSGLLVNLLNPKSVLFAGAVLVVIFPQDLTIAEKLAITLNHFLVEVLVYGALAVLLGQATVQTGYLRLKPVLDRVTAVILGALGLRLLLER